jgi:thioredoxin reductase
MTTTNTTATNDFDVIVIGGSYAGLAAGMALGRALRRVLIIDSGKPCNRQTPHSHNFLTHDGKPPAEIAALARQQVAAYDTVVFLDGIATTAVPNEAGFLLQTEAGDAFTARKLIFAAGISDKLPDIDGLADCWGISVLHCPYCHGYEVRDKATAVLANGDAGFEFAALIANWTQDLTLLTNGEPTLTADQTQRLGARGIEVVSKELARVEHEDGYLRSVVFKDGTSLPLDALYIRPPFDQHSPIPEALGCELTEQGYVKVGPTQNTTIPGVFACGDSASGIRTVANAVASGTTAGMMANKELALEEI